MEYNLLRYKIILADNHQSFILKNIKQYLNIQCFNETQSKNIRYITN